MVGVRTVGGLVALLLAAVYAEEDKPVITLSNEKAMPSVLALLNNELKEVVCTIKRNDVRLNFQCTFGTIFNGLDVDKVHGGITLKWTFTTTSSMHDEICYCFSNDAQSHIVNSTSQFRFQIYGALSLSVTNELIGHHKISLQCKVVKQYPYGKYNLAASFVHSFGGTRLRVLEGTRQIDVVYLSFRYGYQDFGNYTCTGSTDRILVTEATTTVLDLPPLVVNSSKGKETIEVVLGEEKIFCKMLYPIPSIEINYSWVGPNEQTVNAIAEEVSTEIELHGYYLRTPTYKVCVHLIEVVNDSVGEYTLEICNPKQCATFSTILTFYSGQPPQTAAAMMGRSGFAFIAVTLIAVIGMVATPLVWAVHKRKRDATERTERTRESRRQEYEP